MLVTRSRLIFNLRPVKGTKQKQYSTIPLRASSNKNKSPRFVISEEVMDALNHGKPVVALETALLTHGMPPPANLQTVVSVESCVRESGAVPATIGILDGVIRVGMSKSQLERLADTKSSPSSKVSRRDIAAVVAAKGNGGTTIAGTMVIANLAGIKVFATGGLGGVHRGGENSLDISADLTELGRTSVAVFAGGVKSILDIGRTLEYLETQGVPVATYGTTSEFPAFFSPRSGFQSPYHVSNPRDAARIIYHGHTFGLTNGTFFGCPIPEKYAAVGGEIQRAVDQAVAESEINGIAKSGKAVTPWLLNRVYELTGGLSLENNIALIENTSRIGGQVAVEYARLLREGDEHDQSSPWLPQPRSETISSAPPSKPNSPIKTESKVKASLIVIGSAALDITSKASALESNISDIQHSTVPGSTGISLGGVARNVAEAAHRTSSPSSVLLISPIGTDPFGSMLTEQMEAMGMRIDGLIRLSPRDSLSSSVRTAVCNMVLDQGGGLVGGVADMDIINSMQPRSVLAKLEEHQPSIVSLDGNLSSETINHICEWTRRNNCKVFFEPTSIPKSTRIMDAVVSYVKSSPSPATGMMQTAPIAYISPNTLELQQIFTTLESTMEVNPAMREWWWSVIEDLDLSQEYQSQLEILARQRISESLDVGTGTSETLEFLVERGIARMAVQLLPFFQCSIIKCGKAGVLIAMRIPNSESQPNLSWTAEKSDPRTKRQIIARGRNSTFVLKHYPTTILKDEQIVNVTGAGDTLVGTLLATLAKQANAFNSPEKTAEMLERAQNAASLTLRSDLAVSPLLTAM